jgi:N-acetylglucosaminyldiphosphoundecaprenol N-acetyl-beta-D-mannosaminyltransferase
MNTNVCNKEEVLNAAIELASLKKGAYICVSNAHMCIETLDSENFRTIVNSADLTIPDGRSIFWAQKLLGQKSAQQVRGQDIMHAICKSSGKKNLNIGLYGGSTEELLTRVKDKLTNLYPDIHLKFYFSPPFSPLTENEDKDLISKINHADINILFVGIGCPKQETWMYEHKDHLNCVMLGVGAAFDFIAGSKKNAPRWMQKIGLEWFFRLCSEPTRLWKRYLYTNPRFLLNLLRYMIGKRYH